MDIRDASIDAGPSQPLLADDQKASPEVSVSKHPPMIYRAPPQTSDGHVHEIGTDVPEKLAVNLAAILGRLATIILSLTSMIVQAVNYPRYAPERAGLIAMTVIILVYSAIVLLHHLYGRPYRKAPSPMTLIEVPEASVTCCGWKLYICGKADSDNDPPKRTYRLSMFDFIELLLALLLLFFLRRAVAYRSWWFKGLLEIFGLTLGVVASMLLICILRRFKILCSVQWAPGDDDENPYEYQIRLPAGSRTTGAKYHSSVVAT